MNAARERRFALFLLAAVLLGNALALSAELSFGRVAVNDNISHLSLLKGMVRAVENGENPLDFWSPEASFGSPVMRTYQPLAHILVVVCYFALGKTVSLVTVFVWIRYLSVVLLPAGFFAASRLLGFPPLIAAAAALLAPLISTANFYGLDDSSYVSTGRGLFPQSVAAILLLLAIGYGYRAVRTGRAWVLAGLFLGLTAVCHFIYGWMGAVTLCLLALLPNPDAGRWLRVRRTVCVGSVALVLAAFQLLPVLLDSPILNHSRWEEKWKWDSFGAAFVLKALFAGELLDHDRPPVLSLLALSGALLLLWRFWKSRRLRAPEAFVLAGAFLWVLVFFGRPTWGPLLLLLGVSRDLHLHRAVGAVHVFLVLLAAIAMGTFWRELARRGQLAAAILATLLVLAPLLVERGRYLAGNQAVGNLDLADADAGQGAVDAAIADVQQPGGRVYAGSGLTWGPRFTVGRVPFFAYLNTNLVPQASTSYHILALTSEIMPLFDESRQAQYRLFNVRSVVAPVSRASALPAFLLRRRAIGPFQVFDSPGGGYFDIVDAPAAVAADRDTFFEWNERWLHSDWVEKKSHLWLDFGAGSPAGMPRLAPHLPLAAGASLPPAGEIAAQRQRGQEYQADLAVSRPAYALFKMTWHPNWVAWVDGRIQPTAMLSPGFIGVPVSPGRHTVRLSYQPGTWKLSMALAGLFLVLCAVAAERRGYLAFLDPVLRPAPALEPETTPEPEPTPAPTRRSKRNRNR
jgi:hypothetical protein